MTELAENPVIDAGEFLGEDGALSDNWLEQAYKADDPMRTNQTLLNTKGVRSMAGQLVNAEKTIGQLSGGRDFAILPNEQSDEAEIKTYRTKTGVPDEVVGYGLKDMKLPEGTENDEKLSEHMGTILHKAGASSKQAAEIFNGYVDYIKDTMEAAATQDKLDDATANKENRAKLGAAYDKTLRDVTTLVNLFGNAINAEETAAMIKDLPYDSYALQLLGAIASKFDEKTLGIEPDPTSSELTPDTAMAKFNELTKDPYYLTDQPKDKPANKAYHDELIEKGKRLIEISVNQGVKA